MPRPSRWSDVVAGAATVFRDKGYHAASLEDVAVEVGMLKGSLYNYIGSKEELLFAVVRPSAERLLAATRQLAVDPAPAPARVHRLALTHVEVLRDDYACASVYLHEIAGLGRYPEWAAMDREYVALTRSVLAAGVAEGSLEADLDLRTAPHLLLGALNWLTRWWDPAGPVTAEEIAARVSGTFLEGVRRRAA